MSLPKLGLGHFTFIDSSPSALVRIAKQAGFSFVGLRFHPVAQGQLHWLPAASELIELRHTMIGEGISLYDIETIVINESLSIESLLPAFNAAAKLDGQRVNVCADNFDGLAERFASLCEAAASYKLSVDIECMAWRGINTPTACIDLIKQSGVNNATFLVDALHLYRCGATHDSLSRIDNNLLCSVQLCDAVVSAPESHEQLIAEARGKRLLPGQGELPLFRLIQSLPDAARYSVEIPNNSDNRPPIERAKAIFDATQSLWLNS